MIEIRTRTLGKTAVSVPGSKSYTHRMLIASALADGTTTLSGGLDSEDIRHTRKALADMGITISGDLERLTVTGGAGRFSGCDEPIYLGNSGTSMRLLTAVAALGPGPCTLTGTTRMQERPIADLATALVSLGAKALCVKANGCPPIRVDGKGARGGTVFLNCGTSSQFLSAILLIGPYLPDGVDIRVVEGPVSRPYIDITIDVMERFGIQVARTGYERFQVEGGGCYRAGAYRVPPDASQAGYFWAAAAITGGSVTVLGIDGTRLQGDARFVEVLERMGCTVKNEAGGLCVTGGPLAGIEVDMADMPDLVPTLSVVAAFAKGETIICNIAHLRAKESDRISATAAELSKMGIQVEEGPDSLKIRGGMPHGAAIDTWDDHRIAMSFAVAGLRAPGVRILDEGCVAKSFPRFWDVFETLS